MEDNPFAKYAQQEDNPFAKYAQAAPQPQLRPESSGFMQGAGNLAAGALRGAGSIGATITDVLRSKLADQALSGDESETAAHQTGPDRHP